MAIAFNASTGGPSGGSGAANGGVTSLNTTFSNISGADRIALVILHTEGTTSGHAVTMGGVSMGSPIYVLGDSSEFRVYQLINCPVNQASLAASWTGTSSRCALAGVVYTGVDQTTPFRDTDGAYTKSVTSSSLTLDSVVGDVICNLGVDGFNAISQGAGETRRVTMDDFASTFRSLGISDKAGSATSTTASWTSPSSTGIFQVGVSLVPSVASGTTTVNPLRGQLNISGNTPGVNAFTNVRIQEVWINEAGSPVANRTGIQLLVWYEGFPIGAPDLSYSNATTGAAGTFSYSLATGPLLLNQPVFFQANDGSASISAYTCGRIVPTYS